jgi:hypothetical protein
MCIRDSLLDSIETHFYFILSQVDDKVSTAPIDWQSRLKHQDLLGEQEEPVLLFAFKPPDIFH